MIRSWMKFRLHPILLPVFLFLIVTDGLSTYALIFISLLVHEAGHLFAAYRTGLRVRSCTIMPYGGELVIPGRHLAPKKDRVLLALGGPAATILLLSLAIAFPFPGNDKFINIQLALLILNLLPILPLDGGQALSALIETEDSQHRTHTAMLVHSIAFLSATVMLLALKLPESIPYMLLAFFLLIQNISAYRFRKYEKAIVEIKKLNRLTR
jgi:stage IV sporulation protein FB